MKQTLLIILITLLLVACDPMSMVPGADEKFNDQGVKTAIALIELHKIRFGHYPNNLNELKFTGEWDLIYRQFIAYKKLENGYQLDLKDENLSNKLTYPKEFWSGLGLKATNIQGFLQTTN